MTVITMSRNELTRLRVLIDIADGRLSIADATGLIGVGRRQIYRLMQAFRAEGPDGLISRKRGGKREGSLLQKSPPLQTGEKGTIASQTAVAVPGDARRGSSAGVVQHGRIT